MELKLQTKIFPLQPRKGRNKERLTTRAKGIERVVKKRPKTIEKHYDDCGDSLKGLCESYACHDCEGYSSSSDEEEGVPLFQGGADYLPAYWFEPFYSPCSDLQIRSTDECHIFNGMHALTTHLFSQDNGDTICEIAGGEARTTKILIRHHDKRLTTGPNFDLVADVDLTLPREREK